jgi:Flp pilus assembly protein TadG
MNQAIEYTGLKRHKRQGGHAIIELTLAMPLLVGLFLGTWQFGYAFYNYAKLEQAVRAGARYAAGATYDSATSTPSSAYQTAVQNVVVYGNPSPPASPTPVPVAPGLSTGNVVLTVSFASGVPTGVTLAINNYQLPAYFGNATLINKPAAWFPYVGTFGPS